MPRRPPKTEDLINCAMLYFTPQQRQPDGDYFFLSQTQVAERLGEEWTKSRVSRYLDQARSIFKIRFEVPDEEVFSVSVRRLFRLRNARVVQAGSDEKTIRKILGVTAARYIEERIRNKDRVAVSCGYTLMEIARAIKPNPKTMQNLVFSHLGRDGDPRMVHQAPATIVGLLKAKIDSADAYAAQLPTGELSEELKDTERELEKMAHAANIIILGIGAADLSDEDSSFTSIVRKIYKGSGSSPEREFDEAGVVGEINNEPYDELGNSCLDKLPRLKEALDPFFSLSDLRDKARQERTEIIGVAGGRKKRAALLAVLRGQYINVLVTDTSAARFLIEGVLPGGP